MTTEPKASLGRDGAKRSAPDCWTWLSCGIRFYAQPGEDRPDHATALYAAPVLPVEVREKIAVLIQRIVGNSGGFRPSGEDALLLADAILSTITGDA